jgi:hypothetical protein
MHKDVQSRASLWRRNAHTDADSGTAWASRGVKPPRWPGALATALVFKPENRIRGQAAQFGEVLRPGECGRTGRLAAMATP